MYEKEIKILIIIYTMGLNEIIIKLITEPINNMIATCGHSDCKSKCGNCWEIEIDTHSISRESHGSIT